MNCPNSATPLQRGGLGRPPTYCSDDCRREMATRRRDLAALEDELAEARRRFRDERWRPGRDRFWTTTIRMIEAQIAAARERIPVAR
jgi:hypothetical protein